MSLSGYAQSSHWEELTKAGHAAFQEQRLAEAERRFKAAIKETEHANNKGLRLAESFDNLAEVYRVQNKHREAEKLYRQSLVIREKALGESHLQIAVSLDNLADILSAQRKYQDAEPLYQRSQEIRDKALARHPESYVDGQPKPVQKPH